MSNMARESLMTQHIPRPETPSLLREVKPQEQQGLLRGFKLERTRPWRISLQFALFLMPVLWLSFTAFFLLFGKGILALVDALAWSVPLSVGFTLLFHVFYPLFLGSPHLCLRNDTLRLQGISRQDWTLHLDEPFCLHLLYRIDREDALLVIQPEQTPPVFLYGRYRNHRAMPRLSIPITPLGFSLAEMALDQIGAWMLPDRDIEYLPALCAFLSEAPGYDPHEFTLPVQTSDLFLRLEPQELSLHSLSSRMADFSWHELQVQPHVFIPAHPKQPDQLALLLETPEEDPLWVLLSWPLPLHLRHLPRVESHILRQSLVLPTLDAILFLHALNRKGIIPGALSLLQSVPPDEIPLDTESTYASELSRESAPLSSDPDKK